MNFEVTQKSQKFFLLIDNLKQLTKMRLALSVVFSSLAGYLLASDNIQIQNLFLLLVGGYLIVGASNVYNQILEKDLDFLMDRTKNRPLPGKRISVSNAIFIAVIMTFLGLFLLYEINYRTFIFGALAVLLYVCFYTPLKTKTPLSVFVGAIPGAIPFMLGWVAFSNKFGIEPGVLFMIQFFWQFPHFWAIGWMLDDDYKKAGFKMLPTGRKDKSTAFLIVMYTVWMIIISLLPLGSFTGELNLSISGAIIVLFLGISMLYYAIDLMKKLSTIAAKKLMYARVAYITILQLVYVLDKYFMI
jgi:protoheme IX farnesyltransferase